MANPFQELGERLHDTIIRVSPAALSLGMVGAPAIRNVFHEIELRLVDEMHMPSHLQTTLHAALHAESEALIKSLESSIAPSAADKRWEKLSWQTLRAIPMIAFRWDQLLFSLRAKALYAMLPADETWWFSMRMAALPLFFLVSLIPYAGAGTWMFVILFAMIDRTDEYQLAQFILWFKAQQFIVFGVFDSFPAFWFTFQCLADVSQHHLSSAASLMLDEPHCANLKVVPDNAHDIISWLSSALRLLLVWYAFARLCCCSRGGWEQISALEDVRIEIADGTLGDGFDAQKTERLSTSELRARLDLLFRTPGPIKAAYKQYYQQRREKAEAQGKARQRGGGLLFRCLLLWDIFSCVITAAMAAGVIFQYGLGPTDWLTWYTLSFLDCSLAVVQCAPAVVFLFLPWAQMTGARATGYTVHGWLSKQLSLPEIRTSRARAKDYAKLDSPPADSHSDRLQNKGNAGHSLV
ncbi:MAG: hypothetical protein SGPRY_010006 [Prymnesium sp.]